MTLCFLIRLLCLLACLPLHSSYASEKKHERAFYALSSLQAHISELVAKEKSAAHFEDLIFSQKDIARLWQRAAKGLYAAELENIKNQYAKALHGHSSAKVSRLEKVALALNHLWKKSHPFLREKNVPVTQDERRFLLPPTHDLKPALDHVFLNYEPLKNKERFVKAGFNILCQRSSTMIVASHPDMAGYIVKAYLNSDKDNQMRPSRWLVQRCLGAENVRHLIRQKKLKYFTVPDKWIYILPGYETLNERNNAVLVATHVNITSPEETKWAWKNKITKRHLDELFCILSHGFSSTYLVGNIPYTKEGLFSCLDTEYPQRELPLRRVTSHLNAEMQAYWKRLIKKGGPL